MPTTTTTNRKPRKYVGLATSESSFNALEGDILNHLWDAGEPQSSVQVYEVMFFARRKEKREMPSPSTVAVTLSSMVRKGLLTMEQPQGSAGRGRKGYYTPTKSRAAITTSVLDDTSRCLTGQPLGYLLTCLDPKNTNDVSAQDAGLAELIKVLKDLQQSYKE